MIRTASEMCSAARAALSNKWGGAVVITLVYELVYGGVPIIVSFTSWEVLGNLYQLFLLPMVYGFAVAFLCNIRNGEDCRLERLFDGFRDYWRVLLANVLVGIYVSLWTLLLIVPGIIKAYSYAMTNYVLHDYPELTSDSAIERSMEMMKGHKFDLFYLQLTFIGWALLSILTLGIGFLWLIPYMQTATACFYEDVKAEYESALRQLA